MAEIEAELAAAAREQAPKPEPAKARDQDQQAAGGSVRLAGVRLRKVAAPGRTPRHGAVTEENVSRPRRDDDEDDEISGEWERPSTPSSGVTSVEEPPSGTTAAKAPAPSAPSAPSAPTPPTSPGPSAATSPVPTPPAPTAPSATITTADDSHDELELPMRSSLSPRGGPPPPPPPKAAAPLAPLVLDLDGTETAAAPEKATPKKPGLAASAPQDIKLELDVPAPPADAGTKARPPSDPAIAARAPSPSSPSVRNLQTAEARRSSPSVSDLSSPATERTARTILREAGAKNPRGRRQALLVAAGIGILAITGFGVRTAMTRSALEGSEAVAAIYRGSGFTELARAPSDALTTTVPGGVCAVALAGAGGKAASVTVSRGTRTIESAGPVGFCTCGDETITVRGANGSSVRLLSTEAVAFGSTFGFATGAARTATVDTCGNEGGSRCACLPEQVDAWIASHADGATAAPTSPAPTTVPNELRLAGFGAATLSVAGAPLVAVRVGAGECALVAAEASADTLGLRVSGGGSGLASAPGLLAFCSKDARTFGVPHAGNGAVAVLRADAAKIGGRLGVSLLAAAAHTPLRAWVDPADVAWDAETALLASLATGKVERFEGGNRLAPEGRLLVFSFEPGAAPFTPPPGVHCAGSAGELLLCTQLESHSFGQARAALGAAPLPVWLKPATQSKDPAASVAMLAAVRFAARLRAEGYELTILEGVKEVPNGADVLGRAGDAAVIALTVQSTAPFVVPLAGESSPAWTLEEASRPMAIAPGTHLFLKGPVTSELDARRTAVFRRAAKP